MGGRTSTTWEKGTKTNCHSPEAQQKRADTFKVQKLIKGDVLDYIRNLLLSPTTDRKKDPFYQEFLNKLVKEGLKEPNSPVGMTFVNMKV